MVHKISWYFEISAEARYAIDQSSGEYTCCYMEYNLKFDNPIDESKITKSNEEQANYLQKYLAGEFKIPVEWIRPISKDEYLQNTEDE